MVPGPILEHCEQAVWNSGEEKQRERCGCLGFWSRLLQGYSIAKIWEQIWKFVSLFPRSWGNVLRLYIKKTTQWAGEEGGGWNFLTESPAVRLISQNGSLYLHRMGISVPFFRPRYWQRELRNFTSWRHEVMIWLCRLWSDIGAWWWRSWEQLGVGENQEWRQQGSGGPNLSGKQDDSKCQIRHP